MKFSVYYRIQHRDDYFDRFFEKFSKKFSPEMVEHAQEKYENLMEMVVKYLIDEDPTSMSLLLTKPNAKVARMFFDYLTISTIKNKKKSDIIDRINEVFEKENTMIEFNKFLEEKMEHFNLAEELGKPEKIILNEEDDPFADDAGGDDGGNPFGDDDGGDSGVDVSEDDSSDTEGGESGDGEEGDKKENELDLSQWEDDPDFTKGVDNPDDVTLSDTPAGKCIYDVDGVMKSIAAVIQSTSDVELAEIEQVKKDIELIFNGKKLKPEDVTFKNEKNATYLIKKIAKNVNGKTKNYLLLKVKEPLIKMRDDQKLAIAALKKDVTNARDTLQELDK